MFPITDLIPVQSERGTVYVERGQRLNGLGEPVTVILGLVSLGMSIAKGLKEGRERTKAMAQQRSEYEKAVQEIATLITNTNKQANDLRREIEKVSGKRAISFEEWKSGLRGLGLCLINCKQKKEASNLNTAINEYNRVSAILDEWVGFVDYLVSVLQRLAEEQKAKDAQSAAQAQAKAQADAQAVAPQKSETIKKAAIIGGVSIVAALGLYFATKNL